MFSDALFMSYGGYHHHVGVNTWASAGAPPPPPGALGLDRYELVLPPEAAELVAVAGPPGGRGGGGRADAPRACSRRIPSGNRVLIRS